MMVDRFIPGIIGGSIGALTLRFLIAKPEDYPLIAAVGVFTFGLIGLIWVILRFADYVADGIRSRKGG